jgi:MazG family protein
MSSASIEFDRLIAIVAKLRAPDGCPWDREQTIDSLKPFILEETYELIEAIDRHDHGALCEELGDYLFEAVFVAQLEDEAGRFAIADAVRSVADKLVRRHPHVFLRDRGEPALGTADEVRARWEQIKSEERRAQPEKPKTLLGGVPEGLPSLLRAFQIGSRAASVGFDWSRTDDVLAKIQEEVDEVRAVVAAGAINHERAEEEMGDLFFAIANLSRKMGIEPETALRKANAKFASRFTAMETRIANRGQQMHQLTFDEWDEEWNTVKSLETT